MVSPHCGLFVILLFVTSTTGVALFRDIYKRAALAEGLKEQCGTAGDPFVALKQSVKSFTSPNFPNSYPESEDCIWRITTRPGNQIVVEILSIDVEFERKCQYDYLVLYDGPETSSLKDGQYCGKTPPATFTSTGSEVLVTFHSDGEESWKGFEIGYHAIGEADDVVEAKGHGDNDTEEVSGNDHEPIEDNSSEKLLLEEGNKEGPDGGEEDPESLSSYGSSDSYGEATDEETDSQTVEEDGCNQIWHNARQGNITSPGYPGQYPSNADCTIEINTPINRRIDVTFNSFDLEDICTFDYVIIKDSSIDGADPIGKYCGHEVPGLIQSSTGQLIIKFISDAADQRGGFYATFATHVLENVSTPEDHGTEKDGSQSNKHKQSGGDSKLQFISEPVDDLYLEEGGFVRKECEVNKEEGVVSWFKDDELLPPGEETDGMLVDGVGKTLLIPSMEAKHEGEFMCVARLLGGSSIVAAFSLQIYSESSEFPEYEYSTEPDSQEDHQADSRQFETVPSSANVTDGTNHVFFCSTTNENVQLNWGKDDRPLTYNQRIYKIFEANLIISDARLEDTGRYSCIAYSKWNHSKLWEASAYLTVTSSLDVSDVCGIVSAQEVTEEESTQEDKARIVNGKTALKGSSPWMARLWYRSTMKHFCGGSLINNRWVVTAAHCFNKISRPEELEVRLGDHDTVHIELEEMTFRVSQYIVHPGFNQVTFDKDIALIELDRRVPVFTDYIKPICLPNVRTSEELLAPGEIARIAGWGQLIEDGAYPRYLRELSIPIVSKRTCEASTDDLVSDNMFCAGYSKASQGDACQGDSGGPLAQQKDGKWYMTGIISWGTGCARKGKYGFYTKGVLFIDWLTVSMTS